METAPQNISFGHNFQRPIWIPNKMHRESAQKRSRSKVPDTTKIKPSLEAIFTHCSVFACWATKKLSSGGPKHTTHIWFQLVGPDWSSDRGSLPTNQNHQLDRIFHSFQLCPSSHLIIYNKNNCLSYLILYLFYCWLPVLHFDIGWLWVRTLGSVPQGLS
jgi:hypothetical protein